jgi:glycogen phosphorylase
VAIQMNDTHPAIAGPELIRLLSDEHGLPFDEALTIARACLGYTNHTLLPEALERWATFTFGNVLPRHMQIVENDRQLAPPRLSEPAALRGDRQASGSADGRACLHHVAQGQRRLRALHSDLVKQNLFPELNRLHPGRIMNQTNGVTPRRWLRMANKPLAALITETIGAGWEADLDRLRELEPHVEKADFRAAFAAAKRVEQGRAVELDRAEMGCRSRPDAMFDVQIKRIHEYKRQLLNILETIAHWQPAARQPEGRWVPRVKIFRRQSGTGLCCREGNHPAYQ